MKTNFTAINFKTAHSRHRAIWRAGLLRFVNGILKKRISILVQRTDNFYRDRFIDINGISIAQTVNAPTFDKIWQKVEPFINKQNVVALNGFSFDFPCLKQILEYYNIVVPEYTGLRTYRIYGVNLASLCRKHSISLNQHDALSDAMACAELYNLHLKNKN